MRRRWNLKDVIEFIAIVAIYLAGAHFLIVAPSKDPLSSPAQLISFILLFFVMPLHMLTAWARNRG